MASAGHTSTHLPQPSQQLGLTEKSPDLRFLIQCL
jgi:hypothetical protein